MSEGSLRDQSFVSRYQVDQEWGQLPLIERYASKFSSQELAAFGFTVVPNATETPQKFAKIVKEHLDAGHLVVISQEQQVCVLEPCDRSADEDVKIDFIKRQEGKLRLEAEALKYLLDELNSGKRVRLFNTTPADEKTFHQVCPGQDIRGWAVGAIEEVQNKH